MPNRLAHRVALITGAGAGIGRATALLFGQEAARVVVQDLNVAAAQETVELITYRSFGDEDRKQALLATYQERHAVGRFGQAEEIAKVVLFLASDESSFVTGAAWPVDGGLSAGS